MGSIGAMTQDRRLGELGRIVQEWRNSMPYPPTDRAMAKRLGVSPSGLAAWLRGDSFPTVANLEALAREVDASYERLLDAVLVDRGYRRRPINTDPPRSA